MIRPNFGHKSRTFWSNTTIERGFNIKTRWLLCLAAFLLLVNAGVVLATDYRGHRTFLFNIPQQALSKAVIKLGQKARLTIVMPSQFGNTMSQQPVVGKMTPSDALNLLLINTGLGYRFINSNTVSISPDYPKPSTVDNTRQITKIPNTPDYLNGISPIEEVIVTSQRRSENLQRIPKAISVLSSQQLERIKIDDLGGLGPKVPGLTVSYFSLGQPTIHMRGIGSNDDGAALDNSVVVYLDDIFVSRISSIDINLTDVERVEVLRGPQGTLYGRNTIGGAINVISKPPSQDPEVRLSATAGNYNHGAASAVISGPLKKDMLLAKVALSGNRTDGWQKNIFLDEDQHGRENLSVRSKLAYLPNQRFSLKLGADYTWDNLDSTGRIPVAGRVPIRILDAEGKLIPVLDDAGKIVKDSAGNNLLESKLPTDIFKALGGDFEHATNGLSGYTDRVIWGTTAHATWENSWGEFASVTGYRDSDFAWAEDSIGLPPTVTDQRIGTAVDETHRQFSQEFRWTSNENQDLRYVVGLYYLHERTERQERFPFATGTATTTQKNKTNSYALFGQADYALTENYSMSFGARYTHDEKRLNQSAENGDAPAIILENFQLTERGSWNDFSPSLALSYQANEDILIYGSVSRGFKSGGFQGAPASLSLARRRIDPETAWNYEFGVKSEWLRNRLRLNLVTFYTDFRDLQVVQFRTVDNFGIFETTNAASATLRGAETEFIFHPMEGMEISGSYAYLRATYDNFNDTTGRDFNDNRLRQAPKHSFDIGLNYQWRLFEGYAIANMDYRYQGKSFREPDNSITVQPAFDLLDASLGYRSNDNKWEVSIWSKNLLDEEYISHLYVLGGNDYALFGTPRTYGVTLNWRQL